MHLEIDLKLDFKILKVLSWMLVEVKTIQCLLQAPDNYYNTLFINAFCNQGADYLQVTPIKAYFPGFNVNICQIGQEIKFKVLQTSIAF